MENTQRLVMLLILISLALRTLVSTLALASRDKNDFPHCESIVRKWAESSTEIRIKQDKLTLKDLLFFLHVPRTGGRTYFHCFLKKLYVNTDECPRSYDKLRFDPREPKCRLLVTHDDYSLMLKLPKDKTSVVTILRNPIDRIFSTYEFAVEVAARFLVHPNLTSATLMSRRMASKSHGVSTLDIWPWKYLVPWMREDLFARRDTRNHTDVRSINGSQSPYNMNEMVMPLHAFIDNPVVHEIIHNGATFQIAGLTNNSYLAESPKIRHCVRRHSTLGRYVLEVAKSRLDRMLYIGLTEDHRESATIFANMVGSQVFSQSEALRSHGDEAASNETGMMSFQNSEDESENHGQHNLDEEQTGEDTSSIPSETTDKTITVPKMMEAYEMCISSLRKPQARRRSLSLKNIAPANFSKEVPRAILQQILLLNSLDVDLYKHAQHLFMQQQKHLMQNDQAYSVAEHKHFQSEMETREMQYNLYGYATRKVISLALMTLVISFGLVIVTTRRRASKIKV